MQGDLHEIISNNLHERTVNSGVNHIHGDLHEMMSNFSMSAQVVEQSGSPHARWFIWNEVKYLILQAIWFYNSYFSLRILENNGPCRKHCNAKECIFSGFIGNNKLCLEVLPFSDPFQKTQKKRLASELNRNRPIHFIIQGNFILTIKVCWLVV